MSGSHERLFRVRVYECDSLGHVNNAVYHRYLEQATHEAMDDGRRRAPRWLGIQYLHPAEADDPLRVTTRIAGDAADATRGEYEIRRVASAASCARARAGPRRTLPSLPVLVCPEHDAAQPRVAPYRAPTPRPTAGDTPSRGTSSI